MKRYNLATICAALLLMFFSASAVVADDSDHDTDNRMVDAKVVEVTDSRISVIARTGVEHVIAVNDTTTKVKIGGQFVSLKDVRVGDVVTVELDELNQMKFAKNIVIAPSSGDQVARARR